MYLLYFRLDAPLFERIHGRVISALARSDVERRIARAAELVLGQHRALTGLVSPAYGIWGVVFELRALEIASEREEQLEAIRAAARELAWEAVERELGDAVALHTRIEAGVTPWVGHADSEAVRARLARLSAAPISPGRPPEADCEEVSRALTGGGLTLRLQPIVSVPGFSTAGFEALGRGPEAGALSAADRLFGVGGDCGLRPRLELAFLEAALALARRLPPAYWLAVNLSPALFEAPELAAAAARPEDARRLVLEVTEHLPIESPERFAAVVAPLRSRGARLAFDDAGCGFLNMDMVRRLRPDIVKLCITVTSRLARGPEVLAEVRQTVAAVRAAGAQALAEGVETAEQARLVEACGFALAQGFYFARPLAVERALDRAKASAPAGPSRRRA